MEPKIYSLSLNGIKFFTNQKKFYGATRNSGSKFSQQCCSVGSPLIHLIFQSEQLVVLSANCQGLQNMPKRLDVLDYFAKTEANIVCLQDTHWTTRDESIVRSIWKETVS